MFHGAYIEKEQELAKANKRMELLERELMSKDAIDKVFAEKAYSRRVAPNTFFAFKSNQL